MPSRIQSMAMILSAMIVNSAVAQYPAAPQYQQQPQYQAPPVQQVNAVYGAGQLPGAYSGAPSYGQYPQLSAPLYPSPVQNVPTNVSSTMITNQAFAPHEMLYPHNYKAMYGPFYYKVRGGYVWTPFGVRSHENWKLEGTQVEVKYRSQIPLFSRLNTSPSWW